MDESNTTNIHNPSFRNHRHEVLHKKNNSTSESLSRPETNQSSTYNDDNGHKCFCFGCDDDNADTIPLKHGKGKLVQRCVRNVTACTILLAYIFFGAIIFPAIEANFGLHLLSNVKNLTGIQPVDSDPSLFLISNATTDVWLSRVGKELRPRTVENIWDITVGLNILYKENWTRLVHQELASFQEYLVYRLADEMSSKSQSIVGKELHQSTPVERNRNIEWSLAKAFLYSLTVITTIGYGNIGPRTTVGKAVTMGYATIGIPLALMYLFCVGSLLSDCARGVFTRSLCCCLCSKCGYCCYDEQIMQEKERIMRKKRKQKELEQQLQTLNQEPFYVRSLSSSLPTSNSNFLYDPVLAESDCSKMATSQNLSTAFHSKNKNRDTPTAYSTSYHGNCLALLSFCFITMFSYICGGALLFCRLETSWTYLDGVFFCFMALSTIGFAQSIPSSSTLSAKVNQSHTEGSLVFWFCSLYILTGMSLVAMCFNVVHYEIVQRFNHHYEHPPDSSEINKEKTLSSKGDNMSNISGGATIEYTFAS